MKRYQVTGTISVDLRATSEDDAWQRVVLVCFCTDAARCHRAILRERILPLLGAVDAGEIEEEPIQGRLGLL